MYKIIIKITYTFTKSQLKSPLKKHSPCCKIKSHHNITETVILKSPPYFLKHQIKNRKNILSGRPSYTLYPNSRSNLGIFCLKFFFEITAFFSQITLEDFQSSGRFTNLLEDLQNISRPLLQSLWKICKSSGRFRTRKTQRCASSTRSTLTTRYVILNDNSSCCRHRQPFVVHVKQE